LTISDFTSDPRSPARRQLCKQSDQFFNFGARGLLLRGGHNALGNEWTLDPQPFDRLGKQARVRRLLLEPANLVRYEHPLTVSGLAEFRRSIGLDAD